MKYKKKTQLFQNKFLLHRILATSGRLATKVSLPFKHQNNIHIYLENEKRLKYQRGYVKIDMESLYILFYSNNESK